MQALVFAGFILYYAAVATGFNWFLRKHSLWFTGFLSVVASQTVLFGGDALYRGYWDAWNAIALVTTSLVCIPTVAVVAGLFYKFRRNRPGVPPNSTPHTDARASSVVDQLPSARAGGRGR